MSDDERALAIGRALLELVGLLGLDARRADGDGCDGKHDAPGKVTIDDLARARARSALSKAGVTPAPRKRER